MTRKLFVTAMSVLLLLGTTWSCKKEGGVDRGDINAAIKLSASQITASSVVIGGISAQDNVTSCYYLSPVPASEAKMYDMDAIEKKAYILEHGKQTSMPIMEEINKQLKAGTEYTVAAIGLDAQGVFRTAPYYLTFKTAVPEAKTSVKESEYEEGYKYNFTINLNDATKNAKYIVSTDDAVQELDEAGLKAYIEKGGADVKSTAVSLADFIVSTKKTSVTVAAIPYDDMDRAGAISVARIVVEKVKVIDVKKDLKAVKDNYYEGTVKLSKECTFVIRVNDVDYGFTDYSGNGGVGTVNNVKSAMPFYNFTDAMTYKFTVSKAIGQMTSIIGGGNLFWTNMTADSDVFIRIDLTNADGIGRYYFEIPQTDANLIFYEGFDLSVYGGFYQAPVKGTGCDTSGELADGTEPGTMGTISTTTNGIDSFTWPESAPRSATGWKFVISEKLIKNWGLDQWLFAGRSNLSAGHIRIQASSANNLSYAVTPKFTKLTAPTTVTVTIHAFCFAATLAGDFEIAVVGPGKITKSACTNTHGYSGNGGTFTNTTFTPEADLLPKEANDVVNKSIATIVLTVEGATADTQIRFGKDFALEAGNNGRVCIDDIKVTK